tara:strand:- start:280 stop:759 length:480 start_codon:yes stop_codon:yes gene_type:complete
MEGIGGRCCSTNTDMKNTDTKTALINKTNLRRFILNAANSGNAVGDEASFSKISPEAYRNIEAAVKVLIAKEVTGLRKGQIIKFSTLGTSNGKRPQFKRTVPEVVADHTAAQISQMETMNKRLRELEKGQKFLYNMVMPRFGSDGASTKELFTLTETKR